MKNWAITIKALTKKLHFYDQDIAGVYHCRAPTEEKALDWFHFTFPIKVLDDFDISTEEIRP